MEGIKIILARCPMCGVVFPHRERTRAASVNKCCGAKCSANMRVGKKPICAPDKIEAKTVSLADLKSLEADVNTQREAMRKIGVEAKERVATHQRVIAARVEKCCKKCGKVFYVSFKESEAGRGKYCSRDCQRVNVMKPARNIEYVPRPADDSQTTLDGKLSFTTLPEFEAAIGQLMALGYSFRVPGRAFDVNAPQSDFYGLQWGKDPQKGAFVFFYTTKPNTFMCYAPR